MQIDRTIKLFAAALLLISITFVSATADPVADPNAGNTDTPAQSPSETPTTDPGKTPAEGGDNQPFIPSETISADSAIAFPVDI
jgi:hypothetical protein